eukprot:scaffold20989_cov108-Isochrysis_galbana.AAC.5
MVPGACDQCGWALSRCIVSRLACLLRFGWMGDQWLVGKPFPRAFQRCQGAIAIGLCHNVFWVGSCAGCALGEWATNGSLESSFQGLSNGARGGFCGWLVLVPWSVECGLGVTRAVGLCLDAL